MNTLRSAAAEKTIERLVMANMTCGFPKICVYVVGVTINKALLLIIPREAPARTNRTKVAPVALRAMSSVWD